MSRHILDFCPATPSGAPLQVAPWPANTNVTAFGGALFAATDVLYGALLSGQLGGGYQVWTKSATIDFRTPGRGRLRCVVDVPGPEADAIRERLADHPSTSVVHTAVVSDSRGTTVVEAQHTMFIRRKS